MKARLRGNMVFYVIYFFFFFVFNGVTKISFFFLEQWNIFTILKITNLLLQSNLIQACFGDFLDFYVGLFHYK
jgi:hypothetical protein